MAEPVEPPGHTLDFSAGDAVDDPGLTGVPSQHASDLVLEPGPGPHPVDEIRSVERADEHLGVAQCQLGDDVVPHLPGRGGREGVDGELGKVVAELTKPPELRPELMSPLADAVGLVDRHEPDTPRVEPRAKRYTTLAHQPLRGDVEQTTPSGVEFGVDRAPIVRRQRAVERRGRHTTRHQTVHLVLHQRDERRHDKPETTVGAHQRRHLEAQRLAASGGQHDDAVTPVEVRLDRGALQRTELAVAPVAAQRVMEHRFASGPGQIGLGHQRCAVCKRLTAHGGPVTTPCRLNRARIAMPSASERGNSCQEVKFPWPSSRPSPRSATSRRPQVRHRRRKWSALASRLRELEAVRVGTSYDAGPSPAARRQAAIWPMWSISWEVIMNATMAPMVGKYVRVSSLGCA